MIYIDHIFTLRCRLWGGAQGVDVLSGRLCETEAVVKLRPSQSRHHTAPNNDLNVTTDDASGVWKQEPESICSSAPLEENGLKGGKRRKKGKRKRGRSEGWGSEGGFIQKPILAFFDMMALLIVQPCDRLTRCVRGKKDFT